MAKAKIPPLRAEIGFEMPEPVEIVHPDGLRQVLGGPWATFYRMKCVVDGSEAAADYIRSLFGSAERIGMKPHEITKEEYERNGVSPCPEETPRWHFSPVIAAREKQAAARNRA